MAVKEDKIETSLYWKSSPNKRCGGQLVFYAGVHLMFCYFKDWDSKLGVTQEIPLKCHSNQTMKSNHCN